MDILIIPTKEQLEQKPTIMIPDSYNTDDKEDNDKFKKRSD